MKCLLMKINSERLLVDLINTFNEDKVMDAKDVYKGFGYTYL